MSNYSVPVYTLRFPSDFDPAKPNTPHKAWVQFRLGTEKTSAYIALPTPPNLSFQTNIQYNDISLGIIDSAFDMFTENMNKNGGDILSAAQDTAIGVWNGTANSPTAQSGGFSTQLALASSLFRALKISTISGILEPLDVLAKQELRNKGIAVNPNTELYFQDVGLRSFNFTFRLAPKNYKDSLMARKIVRTFEHMAHPNPKERLLLEYPDECIITFYEGKEYNDNVPAINRCVIKSFSHTYNAESTWFENGMPGMIDISIVFQEIAVNTKKTINRLNSDTERQKFTEHKSSINDASGILKAIKDADGNTTLVNESLTPLTDKYGLGDPTQGFQLENRHK